MKLIRFSPLLLALFTTTAFANDYPTLERVDSVMTCMQQHGGQTVENLYSCSCQIDVIASMVPFDIWDEARTFEQFRGMPGEKGGLFRDSARSDEVVPQLENARKEAEKRCFIGGRKHIEKKAESKSATPEKEAS